MITVAETERDEIQEKSRVGAGLVRFMEEQMYEHMHQLGLQRVARFKVKSNIEQVTTQKLVLDKNIRSKEREVNDQKKIIERMKQNQRVREDLWESKFRVQRDLS